MQSGLELLLDQYAYLSPVHRGGFTNHLPMQLIALQRLGASDQTLEQVAAKSAPHLETAAKPDAVTITSDNYRNYLGHISAWSALRDFVAVEIAAHGLNKVLNHYVPQHLKGLVGGSFHGLIRLAYALECGHIPEIAAGLAYLLAAYQEMPEQAQARWALPAALRLVNELKPKPSSQNRLIVDEIMTAAGTALYAQHGLDESSQDMSALASCALSQYLTAPNIDTLHLVTSVHALRVVQAQCGHSPAAILSMARAILAMAIVIGEYHDDYQEKSWQSSDIWHEYATKTYLRDAHTIKLFYSCREEWLAYHDPRYITVVTQQLNLH